MTRLRGRAPIGRRLHDHAPGGQWNTTTMISSIRTNGKTACMTIEGPTTREVFRAYVQHILRPTLHRGDIVILDNLSSHKDPQAIQMLEQVGAEVRFLPPYSPDLNPIEKMWSKVKEFLRSVKARTRQTLFEAIGAALRLVTAKDAIHWFTSCGYSII